MAANNLGETTKAFDAYEIIGIITPGTVVALLLAFEAPSFRNFMGKDGLSVGDFGLFVLVAFVLGHLVQAGGNLLEKLVWPICKMPTNLVRLGDQTLLSRAQLASLQTKVSEMEGGSIDLSSVEMGEWRSITTRAYARVRVAGRSQRIDISNRTYGLCRGLVSAMTISLCWYLWAHRDNHEAVAIIAIMLAAAVWRMRRAGLHYARALFLEFIDLGVESTAKAKTRRTLVPKAQ